MLHNAAGEQLQGDAVVRHLHMIVDGDVKDLQGRCAGIDFAFQHHVAYAGCFGLLAVARLLRIIILANRFKLCLIEDAIDDPLEEGVHAGIALFQEGSQCVCVHNNM